MNIIKLLYALSCMASAFFLTVSLRGGKITALFFKNATNKLIENSIFKLKVICYSVIISFAGIIFAIK